MCRCQPATAGVAIVIACFSLLRYETSAFISAHSPLLPRGATRATPVTWGQGSNLRGFGHSCCLAPRKSLLCVRATAIVYQHCQSSSYAFHVKNKDRAPLVILSAAGDDGGGAESNALLLRMDFEHAEVQELREWIRRYPFGTTLPVQPFSLVETETGVDVIFRKKPTLGKGSQDGGLCFTVEDRSVDERADLPVCPTLIMRRIADGQEIRKMFAERIVVKAVVKSLAGGDAPPGTKVRTVLHEGLV
ncbi:unnamed protein product [Pylaiella littoralis]